jgi:hypothetical protein
MWTKKERKEKVNFFFLIRRKGELIMKRTYDAKENRGHKKGIDHCSMDEKPTKKTR